MFPSRRSALIVHIFFFLTGGGLAAYGCAGQPWALVAGGAFLFASAIASWRARRTLLMARNVRAMIEAAPPEKREPMERAMAAMGAIVIALGGLILIGAGALALSGS